MGTFRFRTIASGSFMIIMIGMLIFPIGILKDHFGPLDVGEDLGLAIIGIYMIGLYNVAIFLSKGIIEVTINREQIDFKWLKKPLTFQSSCMVRFNEIKSWRNRSNQYFELFKIYLTNERTVELRRMDHWNKEKDDYGMFLEAFKEFVEDENVTRESSLANDHTTNSHKITDKEVAFYRSYKGKIALALWIFTLVWAVFVLVTRGDTFKESQFGFIVAGILALVSLIFTYFSKNR